ncbi:MAG: hypothetical protein DMG88_00700 [Acidobacteria bacterium]|nr:MAG: hypothetical protein DMG88_00700 [Acidobacteriota bacterium]
MSGFVLHPDANNDLNEIWEYIGKDNLDAADRTIEEIYAKISSLVASRTTRCANAVTCRRNSARRLPQVAPT